MIENIKDKYCNSFKSFSKKDKSNLVTEKQMNLMKINVEYYANTRKPTKPVIYRANYRSASVTIINTHI